MNFTAPDKYVVSKMERRKHNYRYFIEYFSENMITKKHYHERYGRKDFKNILLEWEKVNKQDDESGNDSDIYADD